MKRTRLTKVEIGFYVVSGLLFLAGLTFIILGLIADNASTTNPLRTAQEKFWSFRYFGLILFSSGALIATFALLFFAREADKRNEREERRKQRLALAEKLDSEVTETEEKEENITDVESTPVEEKKEN